MSLKDTINEDMKTYMREKNQVGLNTVRMLRSEIKNAEIEKKTELNDDDVIGVVQSSIKRRRDSAEQYDNANRPELADKERAEIIVLEKYLPEQLSEDELKAIVKAEIDAAGGTDKKHFGVVMKNVMEKVKGKADGKVVSGLVKGMFDGNN